MAEKMNNNAEEVTDVSTKMYQLFSVVSMIANAANDVHGGTFECRSLYRGHEIIKKPSKVVYK